MPAGVFLLFLPVVDEQPVKGADVHVRFVVLCWDELKVKEILAYLMSIMSLPRLSSDAEQRCP